VVLAQQLRVVVNHPVPGELVRGTDLPVIALESELSLTFGTHPVAVKRPDPRNALQIKTQTSDDFIPVFCRG
jgi:hypothetical protein